jgi:hypothetical protein
MIRRRIFAASAGLAVLALAPQPLAAQEQSAEAEEVDLSGDAMAADASNAGYDEAMAMLGQMFPVEPLTPEQEARLPQAQRIVTRMIPEGTMGEMMGSMFDKLLGPIMSMGDASAMNAVTKGTGLESSALDLTPEQTAELAALFDPAYAERGKREAAVMPAMMRDLMTVMEPSMRKAMSELYAIHFTQAELDGIEAFFQTDIGTAYARKSFTMSSDPRVLSASMEALPQMMESFAAMEQKMAEATADLPARRSFADLSADEQAQVAALTGYGVDELQAKQAEAEAPAEEAASD